MRISVKIIIALSLVVIPHSLLAEENGNFFPNNFARSPVGDTNVKSLGTTSVESSPEPIEVIEQKSVTEDKNVSELTQTSPDLEASSEETKGIPTDKIGAILDARDSGRLKTSLSEMIRLSNLYDIEVGPIYLLGAPSPDEDLMNIFGSMALRGAKVTLRSTPPEEYPVKTSPSWIVSTSQGEVLLEGITDLSSYINSKGELVTPAVNEKKGGIQ